MKPRAVVPVLLALTATGAAGQTSVALDAGQPHHEAGARATYTVRADAGSLVAVRLDQEGLDVAVSVVAPDGSPITRVDGSGGAWGPEAVLFTAETGGSYSLEVEPSRRADGESAPAGHTLRLLSVRPWSTTPEQRAQQLLYAWARASERPGAPGAVAALVRGGELIASAAHGTANLESGVRLSTETVLDIGSVAKELTDFGLVLLVQRGLLGLDDDIREHLPEVPDFGTPITVRHLVHHLSGIREIYGSLAMAGWQAGDGIRQEDALALVTRLRELNFEPGTEYLYCNTGYMLLADIVSRVSGKPFAEFMADEVFGPLGMGHTAIMARRGQVMYGAAESYDPLPDGGWSTVYDNSGIQGAGGIYTTVGDLARWLHNFSTAAVGGATAIRQMQQRGVLADGDTLAYAFGMNIGEMRGLRTLSHTGSSAGFRATLLYFPDEDLGIVTQANSPAASLGPLPRMLAEAVLGEKMRPPMAADAPGPSGGLGRQEEGPRWSPSTAELRALEGAYFSPELETVYTLRLQDGTLVAHHARHGALELEPTTPDRFEAPYPIDDIRVLRDASGRPTGLRISNGRVRDLLFERR